MEPKNPIVIDGLSCDNCPEFKRCQEQRTKKEYAINQVLQGIPSEYANIIDRLKQIIPSITRCDYVLEKQLKRKEQECERLKNELSTYGATGICEVCTEKSVMSNKIFMMNADDFYLMLAIIFWFVGCLFLWNYPIITYLLYTIALVFVIYAFEEISKKE